MLLGCRRSGPVLTVHLADYGESPGRIRINMPQGEAPLYAEPTPVLDERDFTSVSFGRDRLGLPTLSLCFAPEGRDEYTRVVARNVKRRLVFLVRGKLLFAPQIASADVPACATIQGDVSAEDAAALRAAIR